MRALETISKAELEDYIFPGTDAAVLTINDQIPQKELEELCIELSGDHRFYPTEFGWKIKFPYWYIEALVSTGESGFTIDDFEREPKGWDHEHCSFCHEHIYIGDLSFTVDHEDGGVYIICRKCADKCRQDAEHVPPGGRGEAPRP